MFNLEDPLLEAIAQHEGQEVMDILEEDTVDSVARGICTKCLSVMDAEPDADSNWCDECQSNTVKSSLIIAGLI